MGNKISTNDSVESKQRLPKSNSVKTKDHTHAYVVKVGKTDIGKSEMLTVEGYVRRITLPIPEPLKDLILFFYPKPLVIHMQYQTQNQYILYCPISDDWKSIRRKMQNKLGLKAPIRKIWYGNNVKVERKNFHAHLFENELYIPVPKQGRLRTYSEGYGSIERMRGDPSMEYSPSNELGYSTDSTPSITNMMFSRYHSDDDNIVQLNKHDNIVDIS
eukprot:433011_1